MLRSGQVGELWNVFEDQFTMPQILEHDEFLFLISMESSIIRSEKKIIFIKILLICRPSVKELQICLRQKGPSLLVE